MKLTRSKTALFLIAMGSTAPALAGIPINLGNLEAQSRVYRGVSMSGLSSPVKAMDPLTCGNGGQIQPAICEAMKDSGTAFSAKGDFNGDGIEDLAETVVVAGTSGTRYTGIVISEVKHPERAQLFLTPGDGFSALSLQGGILRWHACATCNSQPIMQWIPERNQYRPHFEQDGSENERD